MSRDDDAGKQMINQMVLGTHDKVRSTVEDIKEKYNAIHKLNEVFF